GKAHRPHALRPVALLLETPGRAEVPPLRTVERELQAGLVEGRDLLEARPEGLAEENRLRADRARRRQQLAPESRRHLVRRVAAEALESELGVRSDDVLPVAPERIAIG